MFGLKRKIGGSSIGYLGYSGIIHGLAIAAITVVSQLNPLQSGTESTTVQFEVQSLPKGVQTERLTSYKKAVVAKVKADTSVKKQSDDTIVKNKLKDKKLAKKKADAKKAKFEKEKLAKQKANLAKKQKRAKVKAAKAEKAKLAAAAKLIADKKAEFEKELAAKKAIDKKAKDLKEIADLKALEKSVADEKARIKKEEEQKRALVQQMAREELRKEQLAESKRKAEVLAALPQKATRGYGIDTPQHSFNLRQVPGNVLPRYPERARRNNIQGKGELLYYVTEKGRVTQVKLARSSGNRSLDSSAVLAISRYRYVSGQAGWTKHPFSFDLKGPATQDPSRLRR